jgi:hypothetical protein
VQHLAPHPQYLVGSPRRWAKDYALLAMLITVMSPLTVAAAFEGWWLLALGLPVSALAGATLGAQLPPLLERLRGRRSLPVIGLIVSSVSALLGALTTFTVVNMLVVLVGSPVPMDLTVISAAGAAFAAAQLGWLWLPYAMCRVLRQRSWPVFALAAVTAPLASFASFFGAVALYDLLAPPILPMLYVVL